MMIPRSLLTIDNDAKTSKGRAAGYLTGVMYLAPANTAGLGSVCAHATRECMEACLFTAGRAGIPGNDIIPARILRTRYFFRDRAGFRAMLEKELAALVRQADRENLKPAARLNGTSDLEFHRIYPGLMEGFPRIRFYDYTKNPQRIRDYVAGKLPSNYHLTFSLSESLLSQDNARLFLAAGVNVAAVFRSVDLQLAFLGAPILDGDRNDLRFLDAPGAIVGLKAKGRAKKSTGGFVQDLWRATA